MSEQNSNMNNPRSAAQSTGKNPKPGILGEHPVGVGVGALGGGAAAGAAAGAVAGPIGMVAGAVVGAVVGGLAGDVAAESINPTVEAKYWRENYSSKPYVKPTLSHDEYAPAYRYGWESYNSPSHKGKTFDSVESDLERGWDQAKGASHLAWNQAKGATRDAWDRVATTVSGSKKPASR